VRLPVVLRWCLGLAVAACAVAGGGAVAEAQRELVRLRYQAPEVCPAQPVLEAAILERTTAAQFTTSPRAPRLFTVVISDTGDGYVGSLAVEGGGDTSVRQLAAPRCDDLVAALSLIVALAIDPPGALRRPAPPPAPRGPGATFAALGGGGSAGGVTPGAALTAALEGRVGWPRRWHLGLGGLFGTGSTAMAEGSAHFTWLAGRASACWQWLDRAVASDLCGHVEIGALLVRATEVVRAQERARLWAAPGAHVGVRWPRSSSLFAELELGASVPLVRDRFYFDPDVTVHRTWPVAPWMALSAGFQFGRSK